MNVCAVELHLKPHLQNDAYMILHNFHWFQKYLIWLAKKATSELFVITRGRLYNTHKKIIYNTVKKRRFFRPVLRLKMMAF